MDFSPTKQITERLQSFHLNERNLNVHNQQNGQLTLAKNHLQSVPKLIVSSDQKENVDPVQEVPSNDTVVHRDQDDFTLPDWIQVKLRQQQQQQQQPIASHLKPKLANIVSSHANDDGSHEQEQEDISFFNSTWEALKKQYHIEAEDLQDAAKSFKFENSEVLEESKLQATFNNSDYSFQDLPKMRISSDIKSSMKGTHKVTSYKNNYNYIDSPMGQPKLIKNIYLQDITNSSYDQDDITEKPNQVEIKLITPLDENMRFDSDQSKWVFPNTSDDNLREIEELFVESGDNEDNDNDNNDDNSNTNAIAGNNDSRSGLKDSSMIDAQHVTNVSQLDLSFSESRKQLVSALTSALNPGANWDAIDTIDISNKRLITVKSLQEFVPNITSINLNYNHLTSLEGLPSNLQKLSMSHNHLCDYFLNFQKFRFVQYINLTHNKLSNLRLFKDLVSLRELDLSHNEVEFLTDLPSLQTLNLSYNKIEGPIDFKELTFPNLQSLDLSHNRVTKIQNLRQQELRILKISHNEIDEFDFRTELSKMKKLNISNNKKMNMEVKSNLINLRFLSIDSFSEISGEFPKLESLYIKGDNQLYDNLNTVITSSNINKHLIKLSINDCQLDFEFILRSNFFSDFKHLQKIDLRNNNIDCSNCQLLEFFKKFNDIKVLNLENNPITNSLTNEQDSKLFKLMISKLINGD